MEAHLEFCTTTDRKHSLFENPKFSDFIITCEGTTWNVHKIIVSGHSDVFAKACGGQFKVSPESLLLKTF